MEGIEDLKLATRVAGRIWLGAETARAAARRKMYLDGGLELLMELVGWFRGHLT